MKITFKQTRITTAVVVALTLSSCVRFESRMQANGSFEYQQAALTAHYDSGDFITAEERSAFEIPPLTDNQKSVGLTTTDVDIRPPTQLMPVIDGVLLDKNDTEITKVWFNAFSQDENMQHKVWSLLESYLAQFDTQFVTKNQQLGEMETENIVETVTFGKYFNVNTIVKDTRYKLSIEKQNDSHSVGLIVDALSYKEMSGENELKINLVGSRKQDVELQFVNSLLAYAYQVKESEQLVNADTQPLTIKLGFDDNHQNAWIVESDFEETWRKLPTLFSLLNFEIVEDDKNLGYFLLNYVKPIPSYWEENELQPFDLFPDEYFVQLGQVAGGVTSLLWLDDDKKPLTDEKITEIYLSITKHVRGVLLENDKQTTGF